MTTTPPDTPPAQPEPFRLVAQVPPPPCTCDYEMLMAAKRQEKGPTKAKKNMRQALHSAALWSARFCDRHNHLWLRARGL